MFLDELDQRSGRLASAARLLANGDAGSLDVSAMRREGHTIKGTARVMGYETIGLVALMIEEIWDGIAAGDLDATASLGEALAKLCVEMELAGRENPQLGTPSLREAAAAVHEIVPTATLPDFPETPDEPEPLPAPKPQPEPATAPATAPAVGQARATSAGNANESVVEARSPQPEDADVIEDVELLPPASVTAGGPAPLAVLPSNPESASRREAGSRSDTLPVSTGPQLGRPASRREPPDLPVEYGGVIGAVESWATEGTVIVNAGRLYRLINRIAATRAEAGALAEKVATGGAASDLRELADGMARAADALQTDVLGLASLPLSTLTGTLPQLVKYLSKKLGKNVELEVAGDAGVVIDRQVLETISEPVRQLIVNAIYHGLEVPSRRKHLRKPNVGSITLDVVLEGNMLELVIADDGAGVDWDLVHSMGVDLDLIKKDAPHEEQDLIPLLFEPGFTTGAIEGGRGDGLARLASAVEALHGRVHFETWADAGTRVSVRVPAWQALQRVLIVWAGGMRWAIPEAAVERTMSTAEAGVGAIEGTMQIDWEGRLLPLLPLATAAGVEPSGGESLLVILSHRVGSAALAVESIEGSFEVAITELAPLVAGPEHITGVALLGAGEIALVIDAGRVVEQTRVVPGDTRARARVLVVDDSEGGRAVLSGSLSSSGFSTSVAGSVAEALEVLSDLAVDAFVIDFSLPSASGIALVEEVRRRDKRIPIVMISGSASEEDKIRAKKAGVDRFFDKSDFREGALATALWDLLEA
jgi:chemotaxis protein histidine kinase CheA